MDYKYIDLFYNPENERDTYAGFWLPNHRSHQLCLEHNIPIYRYDGQRITPMAIDATPMTYWIALWHHMFLRCTADIEYHQRPLCGFQAPCSSTLNREKSFKALGVVHNNKDLKEKWSSLLHLDQVYLDVDTYPELQKDLKSSGYDLKRCKLR